MIFVLIGYGAQDVEKAKRQLDVLRRKHNAKLTVVDTSLDERLANGFRANDAFEFTGYQLGIQRAIAEHHAPSQPGITRPIKLVLLNSTAFSAHLFSVTKMFIDFFAAFEPPQSAGVMGYSWVIPPRAKELTAEGFFYGSFILGFWASQTEALTRCTFFDARLCNPSVFEDFRSRLPQQYNEMITDWLVPRGFLRGWYQASPLGSIDGSTFHRKRLTIYLEHTLPERLRGCGLSLFSVNRDTRWIVRLPFVVLLLFDRAYVNGLKLRRRVRRWLEKTVGRGTLDNSP